MLALRKSHERGHANHGWLDSRFTFSFADYYDPAHMGFRALRVINDDHIAGGGGFPTHPHRDMEILTYVLSGALEHKDSLGNGSVMRYGDVQRMSAGTGVRHSEFNHSAHEEVHLLQIWIEPSHLNIPPGYAQRFFDVESKRGGLCLVASPEGEGGSVTIHADARLYAGILSPGVVLSQPLGANRHAWVHLARGAAVVHGETLSAGDALSLSEVSEVRIEGEGEVLFFDLG